MTPPLPPPPPPPLLPPSPVERTAACDRFLIFDVIFHEQVNKQRRALMFFLDLAMKLRRALVLPRTRLVRRRCGCRCSFEAEAEYVRWGALFNASHLGRLHPVIELDEFVAARRAVGVASAAGADGEETLIDLHVRVAHTACEPRDHAEVPLSGLGGIRAVRSQCAPTLQHDLPALRALWEEAPVLAFTDSVNQLGLGPALRLRPYVRFEQSVYAKITVYLVSRRG